ncbi:MAG: phosphoenolpyruvate--protein phosphotransferase [Gammaproteobacteria bacterium]|nr:MAG: phosphoenolpyruvate--protein phosphotransferase [Gammaproteobacteria bacterium]
MTFALHGVGVSRGIAIGPAHIIQRDQIEITEYPVDGEGVNLEIRRFQKALTQARQQLRAVREHIPRQTPGDIAAFIDSHLLMLEDSALTVEPVRLIREMKVNAEWALKLQRDALIAVFDEMEDAYLRTRKDDIDHVVNRLQRILLNHPPLRHELPDNRLAGYVVIADDLSPADTVMMQGEGIVAFATEHGGPTSHTAILARSLGIPSVVGLHQARRYLREDDLVIVDGNEGVLLVDPDEATLEYYREQQRLEKRHRAQLRKLRGVETRTRDGTAIELMANIELPEDFRQVLAVGADGVGLYRTEYLFMNRESVPDEEEQYKAYVKALRVMKGLPITIRTVDLGADKPMPHSRNEGGQNPALGLRGIRLCLREPGLFQPQLRALIRASASGPLRLMLPMLSTLQEVEQSLELIRTIQQEFREREIPFDPDMPIGGMIEVPAAALCADLFAERLDFLSLGTNDLIQYTMAIDRVNDQVNYLYDPLNPGILRLVHEVLKACEACGKPVTMCGEMAADPRCIPLLLGMGLRSFSVHPGVLLEVRKVISEMDLKEMEGFIRKASRKGGGFPFHALYERYRATLH